MRFSDFIGRGAPADAMRGDIASGRSVHAYLFAGPAGTGKRTLAELCARAWNCLGADKPCDVCAHCVRALGGNDPDLMVLQPEKSIGVDDVRALGEWLSTRPSDGGRRVAIVQSADKMTVPAQNALLKTLESPPGDAVIVLIAESTAAMLSTVVSRCRIMRFSPLAAADAERVLITRGIASERAALLVRLSMGSVGRALAIDQSESWWALRDRTFRALESLISPTDVGPAAAVLLDDDGNEALDAIELWARDRLSLEAGGPIAQIDREDALRASALDGAALLRATMDARRRLKSNVSWPYVLETTFFTALGGYQIDGDGSWHPLQEGGQAVLF